MAGLARAAFDAFVWGAEIAPIEKLRDGQSTGLRWPSFESETQQATERWCRREGGALERRCERVERVGEDV